MERLRKFCLTAFDITSMAGQHRIILVTKKLLCTNILRFHLLICGFFSFIFFFYLATTSHPHLALSLKCVQPEFPTHQWDPLVWIPVPGWILKAPTLPSCRALHLCFAVQKSIPHQAVSLLSA